MKLINPFNAIDATYLNLSGSIIKQGTFVSMDPTPSASAATTFKPAIDPFPGSTPFPLQGIGTEIARLVAIAPATSASSSGNEPALGVAIADIPSGEWGMVRIWGPARAICTATADLAHLSAYGISTATAGALADIAPVSADPAGATALVWTVAFQVGASGTTTTLDQRDVFVLTAFTGGVRDDACPFGTLI